MTQWRVDAAAVIEPELRINPRDPKAYEIHTTTVMDNVPVAYIHEGKGGVPLLMINGWPGTKRIFYKNIEPLADAGFEVVVPDHSGWGDSPPAYRLPDPTFSANMMKALMEQLGHDHWVVVAFDFGSVTAMHMVNRWPERIIRQVIWNGMMPMLPDEYEAGGIGGGSNEDNAQLSTHLYDHGHDPDAFVATFDTVEKRRAYVVSMYQERVWMPNGPIRRVAAKGAFDDETAAFHAQPFDDPAKFRASINYYAALMHPELCYEPMLLSQKTDVETMVLYGMEDEMCGGASFTRRAEIAYPNLVGPFHVTDGGHFLCWERPTVVNSAIRSFCRDLLAA